MYKDVTPDSSPAEIISEEEKILAETLNRLLEFLNNRTERFSQKKESVYQKARESILELRGLVGEATQYDIPALTEQMHHLAALTHHLDPDLQVPADPQCPYFAHIQLQENDRKKDVLIGKRSFVDPKNKINIVDWRNAPVSQLYYTCEEGAEYDTTYGSREVEGVMLIRRALSIIGGTLHRINTPQEQIIRHQDNGYSKWVIQEKSRQPKLIGGQGAAKRAPKERRRFGTGDDYGYRVDKHLPEIAALIDPEQFRRITGDASGIVILQGGAGSGKTTVALHRVAYLNFLNKDKYHGKKVLITVFNRALARYIERVLPALDVQGVRVWTYSHWAHKIRRRLLPALEKREWQDIPVEASKIKKHPAMLTVLKKYVEEQTASFADEMKERLDESLLEQWQRNKELPLIVRLQKMIHLVEDLQRQSRPQIGAELVFRKALDRAKDIYTDWAEIVTDQERLMAGFSSEGETKISQQQFERFVAYCSRQISERTDSDVEPINLDENKGDRDDHEETGLLDSLDNTLLIRLNQIKYGGLRTPEGQEIFFNHSVIDEAQDLSPLEIQVIVDATNSESVTLAGDTAQKLIFDNGFEDWTELMKSIGKEAIQIDPLKIGYRSTHEINLFARAILGDLAPNEPVQSQRSGVPVEVFVMKEVGECVAFLTDALRELMSRERMANVALLTLLPNQADFYYEALKNSEISPLRRVKDQDFSFQPGIDVTDISQIKGLEYDYVVILDVNLENFPETNESRHLLHIAATRAAHQLWGFATGIPSKLIPKENIIEL